MHAPETLRGRRWARIVLAICLVACGAMASVAVRAQTTGGTDAMTRRVNERIAALQAEAERLAAQARTLIADLRQLEIKRDIEAARAAQADAEVVRAQDTLNDTNTRILSLEQQRGDQLPDLKLRLADIYMRGRGGYARMLLDARGVREFARAMRAASALSALAETRIADQRRTQEVRAAAAAAQRERAAAQRALNAREALVAQIDARRDLNAQLSSELRLAADRLQDRVLGLASDRTAEGGSIPITSFRGGLDWPAPGRLLPGLVSNNPAGTSARNGVTIAAPQGAVVSAIYPGTVTFAGPFEGFGNLVIIDHGSNAFSLYGYLGSIGPAQGARVDAGAQVGEVGTPPVGPAALYFELRIDGRSVDPVEWMKPR
jgi:septal ring factor EnvC (AmiA/AmiB activator)